MLFDDQVTPAVGRPDCPLTSTIATLPVERLRSRSQLPMR